MAQPPSLAEHSNQHAAPLDDPLHPLLHGKKPCLITRNSLPSPHWTPANGLLFFVSVRLSFLLTRCLNLSAATLLGNGECLWRKSRVNKCASRLMRLLNVQADWCSVGIFYSCLQYLLFCWIRHATIKCASRLVLCGYFLLMSTRLVISLDMRLLHLETTIQIYQTARLSRIICRLLIGTVLDSLYWFCQLVDCCDSNNSRSSSNRRVSDGMNVLENNSSPAIHPVALCIGKFDGILQPKSLLSHLQCHVLVFVKVCRLV